MTSKEINDIAKAVVDILEKKGFVEKPNEKLMTSEEAAKFLCISVRTLYKKIESIPHIKTGKLLLFSERTLAEYRKREYNL